jgi:hypothetical protein
MICFKKNLNKFKDNKFLMKCIKKNFFTLFKTYVKSFFLIYIFLLGVLWNLENPALI